MRCTTRTEHRGRHGGAAHEVHPANGQPTAKTSQTRSKGSLKPRRKQTPPLVPLRYGARYCELCHETVRAGERVAWWRVQMRDENTRPALYCQTCHHQNVRAGRPLQ
jgi:hypothetical protein